MLLATRHNVLLAEIPRLCSCLLKAFCARIPKGARIPESTADQSKCHSDIYIITLSYGWISVLSDFWNPLGFLAEIAATCSFEAVAGRVGQGSF